MFKEIINRTKLRFEFFRFEEGVRLADPAPAVHGVPDVARGQLDVDALVRLPAQPRLRYVVALKGVVCKLTQKLVLSSETVAFLI